MGVSRLVIRRQAETLEYTARYFTVSTEQIGPEILLHCCGYDDEDRRIVRVYAELSGVVVTVERVPREDCKGVPQ